MNVKKGVKNIVYSFLGQAITMALGIIIPKLVIESYGSEVNGLLSSVSQVIQYLALLEAGVGAAAVQALYRPISDNNRESINSIMAATHHYYRRTGIIYLIAVVCMAFVYPFVVKTELNYWFIAVIVIICGLPSVISYFFQGKLQIFLNANGDSYIMTNLSTATSVFASITKIVLLMTGMSVILVQTIYCVVSLIQMVFLFAYVKKKYPWMTVRAVPDKDALKQKNSTLIHQICSLVTNSTDVVVLSIFCDLKVASIYAIYNMIFSLIGNITTSINNGIQFIFGNSYCKGKKYYIRILDTFESYFLGTCSALMCTTCILAPSFITLYTANADINYLDFGAIILFAGFKILSAVRFPAMDTITVAGHFRQTIKHSVIESTINLFLSLILVNVMEHFFGKGLYGVLIGTLVSLIYRDIVSIHYANVNILERKSGRSIKVIFLNILLFAALVSLGYILDFNIQTYISWFLHAIPIAVVIFICFLALNSLASIDSFKHVFSYLKRKLVRKKGDRDSDE